jgi:hypothetical protein
MKVPAQSFRRHPCGKVENQQSIKQPKTKLKPSRMELKRQLKTPASKQTVALLS